MNKRPCYLSTSYLAGLAIEEVLAEYKENGISAVELSAAHPYQEKEKITRILLKYKELGFSFTTHNYFPPQEENFILNIASSSGNIREKNKRTAEAALKICSAIGSPVYGIHCGYTGDGTVDEKGFFRFQGEKKDHRESLNLLAQSIREFTGINPGPAVIAVENLFPEEKSKYSMGCSFQEIKEILDILPRQTGLLLDLGHLNISANLLGFEKSAFFKKYLTEFGTRLCEVHLSENNGIRDEHLPILKEDSWQLKAIKEIEAVPLDQNFSRIYCLEVRNAGHLDIVKQSLGLIENGIKGAL